MSAKAPAHTKILNPMSLSLVQPCSEGDYVYFGTYPQDAKEADVTITEKQDARGYYLGSDGSPYAEVGDKYFKVMPIKWRVLEQKDRTAFLFADRILDAHRFDANSNQYAKSEIRAWLNKDFYHQAFDDGQKNLISSTEVDNSVCSTYPPYDYVETDEENRNHPDVTRDNVYLLSMQEVTDPVYGFFRDHLNYDAARLKQGTDYACSRGVFMITDGLIKGNGAWWLRSPHLDYRDRARYVNVLGDVGSSGNVSDADIGVVPALRIILS